MPELKINMYMVNRKYVRKPQKNIIIMQSSELSILHDHSMNFTSKPSDD